MLDFPSYGVIQLSEFVFAVVGIAMAISIVPKLRSRSQPIVPTNTLNDDLKMTARLLASITFILGGSIALYFSSIDVYRFRHLRISEIKSVRISQIESEGHDSAIRTIDIDNSQTLQDALSSLHSCYGVSRNHESFYDGYRFEFQLDDASVGHFGMLVFRHSNTSMERSAVIPYVGSGRAFNLGDFGCPTFQNWVKENIDPFFSNQQNTSSR